MEPHEHRGRSESAAERARILQVGDEPTWHEVVQQALAHHDLDVAADHRQATALLRIGRTYDLAVVDLHPTTGGGELLELLWTHYPDTRRVVVAEVPPRQADRRGRAGLFARYGVEEVLTRSTLSAPDLRQIVGTALEDEAAVETRIRRADLRRRYQDWRSRRQAELEARVRTAEIVAGEVGRAPVEDALVLYERFTADAYETGIRIERAVTVPQILDAADVLVRIEELYPEAGEL